MKIPFYTHTPPATSTELGDPSVVDLRRLLAGEGAAWDDFVAWSLPSIKAAVRQTLTLHAAERDSEDIEDIIQNVYLRLIKDDFRLLRQYDSRQASMKTWLLLIARGTTLNCLAQSPPVCVPLDALDESLLPPPEPKAEPLAIPPGTLSEQEALIIHFHYRSSLSLEEIARQMRLSRKTVYNCKSIALTKLREHFSRA